MDAAICIVGVSLALWAFDGKRGDKGERNMENLKQGQQLFFMWFILVVCVK